MPRCAEPSCRKWRPGLGTRVAGGVRLNGQWFCSVRCLEPVVAEGLLTIDIPRESAGARPSLRLGALLRFLGAITGPQLRVALDAQRRSGRRLGAELQALGLVNADTIVRALAIQADMSYLTSVDLTLVQRAPGGLPGHTVRALGLVPLEVDQAARRLRVLCTAPAPKAAFRALSALAGWEAEPYLVDDGVWERAMAAYPATGPAAGAMRDLRAVAAHVARTAGERGALTMRRAACPGGVWVRLEDAARVEDLVIAPSLFAGTPTGFQAVAAAPSFAGPRATEREEPCLVASTPR